jgi:hypothetical protein
MCQYLENDSIHFQIITSEKSIEVTIRTDEEKDYWSDEITAMKLRLAITSLGPLKTSAIGEMESSTHLRIPNGRLLIPINKPEAVFIVLQEIGKILPESYGFAKIEP